MHGGNVWRGESPAQWLDYSANIRPEGPPEWVRSALRRAIDEAAYYPEIDLKSAGAAVAAHLGLPAELVRATAGGISAIDLAAHAGTGRALLFSPCFGDYARQARNRGAELVDTPLLAGLHRRGPLQAELAAGDTIFLCNPSNPLGSAAVPAEIEALLKTVEKKDGWLVVDEAFIDYCPEFSVRNLLPVHERLLICGSFTKILGVPGVRLGYLCAAPKVLARLERFQLNWEINCFAAAVARALPGHADWFCAEREKNDRRRAALAETLRVLGAFVYPSEANFLLTDFGRPVSGIARALTERGILVRECRDFAGIDEGNHLRWAVKDEASNICLIDTLREVLPCAENL